MRHYMEGFCAPRVMDSVWKRRSFAMPYSLAHYTRRLLLVPIGVVCMTSSVHSENLGSLSDGLCNYCAEHSSGALRVGQISTAYVPMRGFSEEPALARRLQSILKPEMQVRKPVSFEQSDTISYVQSYTISHMSNANDGLCNYCGKHLAGNVTADRSKTIYAPLSGYGVDANPPSDRSLARAAIY